MLNIIVEFLSGSVAQLIERFNGIEQSKYPNLNTNEIHTGHCFQVKCDNFTASEQVPPVVHMGICVLSN